MLHALQIIKAFKANFWFVLHCWIQNLAWKSNSYIQSDGSWSFLMVPSGCTFNQSMYFWVNLMNSFDCLLNLKYWTQQNAKEWNQVSRSPYSSTMLEISWDIILITDWEFLNPKKENFNQEEAKTELTKVFVTSNNPPISAPPSSLGEGPRQPCAEGVMKIRCLQGLQGLKVSLRSSIQKTFNLQWTSSESKQRKKMRM